MTLYLYYGKIPNAIANKKLWIIDLSGAFVSAYT